MSGSPRKRVTFADLVSARLPSTSPPTTNHTPDDKTTESDSKEVESIPAATDASTLKSKGGTVTDSSPTHAHVPAEGETLPDVELLDPVAPSRTLVGIERSESTSPSRLVTQATEELAQVVSQPPDNSQPHSDSQSPDNSQSLATSQALRQAGGSQIDSQSPSDSQPPIDSQSARDRHPLKEVKGYLKLPNTVVDSLLPTLDVYEQATFVQLYRLAHGFGNYTCKISLPALQTRTGVKLTSLKQSIARLQARGIVEKLVADIGFGREQGITYWVSPDGRQTYTDWQSSGDRQSPDDYNKIKENLKETNSKGRLTPEQIKNCPDCQGVGMWYPDGPGKGVARCLHPGLREKK